MVNIGDTAPAFTLKNTEKSDVSLADYSGQTVILAFYPGAFTGVCDKEMCAFQDNLGTVTMGFGGLVDGYWCYHQTCDTVDEMVDWMDTTGKDYGEEQSGTSNLVDALDTITWWATYSFFHLDEQPIRNAYL